MKIESTQSVCTIHNVKAYNVYSVHISIPSIRMYVFERKILFRIPYITTKYKGEWIIYDRI